MPDELAAKRFDRADLARDTSVSDMLNKVLVEIEAGLQFDHVMVLCSRREEDGSVLFRKYQAGDYNYAERLGLLENTKLDEWQQC